MDPYANVPLLEIVLGRTSDPVWILQPETALPDHVALSVVKGLFPANRWPASCQSAEGFAASRLGSKMNLDRLNSTRAASPHLQRG